METEGEKAELARPKFKHVQPSGRGMQSEHELAAKREAVALIEERFARNEKVRKSAARRRTLSSFCSVVIGLAALVGVAYYLTHRDEGLAGLKDLAGSKGLDAVKNAVGAISPGASLGDSSAGDAAARDRYASVAKEFTCGELAHWREAPDAIRPKNAPAGTAYHALVPRDGTFGLYELKAGGGVAELSPFGRSLPLTTADFRKACGGRPYFIACAGRVFVCGNGDLKKMDELRKALLPR